MKTTRIFASQAVPGMVVAEDVYTFNNQMIINCYFIVFDDYFDTLECSFSL